MRSRGTRDVTNRAGCAKKRRTEPTPLALMVKNELVDEMGREHPLVILNMETLAANARSASEGLCHEQWTSVMKLNGDSDSEVHLRHVIRHRLIPRRAAWRYGPWTSRTTPSLCVGLRTFG
ncbi:hypothetical protein BG011_000369 [Mortierella polycephala]|uniref:Uncharacterized protein n=1 Tax=Mortierella polycephala TaxID=41804 RepID=A0A9P6PLR4_9FUNG|nr:hypothetical protein BG011_000369 [Mortierella polycephala]